MSARMEGPVDLLESIRKKNGKKGGERIAQQFSDREEMVMDQCARSVAALQNTCQ